MASPFRALGEGDGGEASPPASGPPHPSRWLSGLISSASRLISSVLDSSPSGEDGDLSSDSDEGEDADASADDIVELNKIVLYDQRGKTSKVAIGNQEGSLAIVTKKKSKHTIEQLLMAETFSRDECDKLTKIIQSRVVKMPSVEDFGGGNQKEHLSGTSSKKFAFSDTWQTLDQVQKMPETTHSISTGWQVHTPDHHGTVVMEARKRLEEKKPASSSKSDFVYGPCTLNTDMSLYHSEGEVGSPVEVAKSYMSSLSSWRSPLFSTRCRNTPSSAHLSEYGSPHATVRHAVYSAKALKRRYLSFESQDILDETQRTGPRSIESQPESFKLHQFDLSARLLGLSSASDNREGAHLLNLNKSVDTNVPANMDRTTPVAEDVTIAAYSTHPNSAPVNLPLQINSGVRTEPISCMPAANLHENMAIEEPFQIKNFACACVTLDSLGPMSVAHDGANAKCPLNSKQRAKPSEKSNSMPSSSGGLMTIPLLVYTGSPRSTYSNNSELLALDISGGFHENTTGKLPLKSKYSRRKPRKGTTMRSIKQVLSESQPSPSKHQDRKVAVKPKRGRRRGTEK